MEKEKTGREKIEERRWKREKKILRESTIRHYPMLFKFTITNSTRIDTFIFD
jgi:hypothetical protein